MYPSLPVLCFQAGSHAGLLVAGGGGAALCHMGIPVGCLSVLPTWWLAFPRMGDERETARESKEEAMFLYVSISEVTHCHFCHILFVRSESLHPAHMPEEGNQASLFERRSVAGFVGTFLNHHNLPDELFAAKTLPRGLLRSGRGRKAGQEGRRPIRCVWRARQLSPTAPEAVLLRTSGTQCRLHPSFAPAQAQGSWGVPPTLKQIGRGLLPGTRAPGSESVPTESGVCGSHGDAGP